MKLLHRYIAKTVIVTTLLVIAVMIALSYFIGFLGELRDIGVGNYGVVAAAVHVFLQLPHTIYQFFPMLVLVGGLMSLGILTTHQELIVMRVSGLSRMGIIYGVFGASLILIIIGILIGEVLGPVTHHVAAQHKDMAKNAGQAVATASGVWIHEGDSFFHIDRVLTRHHLEKVTRYEFNANHELLAVYFVKTMNFQNKKWLLHDVVKTTLSENNASSEQVAQAEWSFALNPNLLNIGLIEPDEIPLHRLIDYTNRLNKNGLQAAEFQFNLWQRLLRPLTILVMLLLAIPFVFSAPRSVTLGLRTLIGIIVGFVFYIFNALLGQLCIVFQVSPFLGAFFPILLFALLGWGMLIRAR